MSITAPADLEAEFLRQRDRLSETVGAFAERFEDLDVLARAEDVLGRAETGATELIDASTDDQGRPKPAVLIGGAVAVVVLAALLRRRSRARKAATAAQQGVRA